MCALFQRQCRVIIGRPPKDFKTLEPNALEIENLRVQFKIVKTSGKEPNTAEISITNLAETTRKQLQGKGMKVILVAGYPTTMAQVFAGDSITIDHPREGTEFITKIRAGDGARPFLYARVNESFVAGTKVADVVKVLVDALGIDPGNAINQSRTLTAQYVNGYTAFGPARTELDRVLTAQGITWSVQDGRLVLMKKGETTSEQIVEIGPESGLIGSPEHGSPPEKGKPVTLKVKSLLQSSVKPHGRIKLVSRQYNGIYVVQKVTHTGDTAGGDWYTEAECLPK